MPFGLVGGRWFGLTLPIVIVFAQNRTDANILKFRQHRLVCFYLFCSSRMCARRGVVAGEFSDL